MTMYVSYKRKYAKFLNPAEEIHFLLLQLLRVHLIFYMKKANSDNCLRIQGVVIYTIVRPQIQYFYCNLVINSQISKKSIVIFIFVPTQHIETLKEDCVWCYLIFSLIEILFSICLKLTQTKNSRKIKFKTRINLKLIIHMYNCCVTR